MKGFAWTPPCGPPADSKSSADATLCAAAKGVVMADTTLVAALEGKVAAEATLEAALGGKVAAEATLVAAVAAVSMGDGEPKV